MSSSDFKDWSKDYQEFSHTESAPVPGDIGSKILNTVHKQLNPSTRLVFLKLLLIYSLTGALTLLICPQYGLGQDLGLMSIFMTLGHHGCMAACGAFFLGSGTLVLLAVLRREELAVARRFQKWQIPLLALILQLTLSNLGYFYSVSASLIWLAGAICAAYLVLTAGPESPQGMRLKKMTLS